MRDWRRHKHDADRSRRHYDPDPLREHYDDLNGYYDPAISEALIAKEVVKQLKRTPSRIMGVAKKAKRFAGQTMIQKHLWWVFPLFVFIVGCYALWVAYKSRVAHISEYFGEFLSAPWNFTILGFVFQPDIVGLKKWILGPFSAFLPPDPSEEEKKNLMSFTQDFQIWLVVWGAICCFIAMWLYSQKEEREKMMPPQETMPPQEIRVVIPSKDELSSDT